MRVNEQIIQKMASHFLSRGDTLSLDVLKFALLRPVLVSEAGWENEWNFEFTRRRQEFFDKCTEAGSVVIYGAGSLGVCYIHELEGRGITIPAVIDTFKAGSFCLRPLISLREYKEKYSRLPIVVTPRYAGEEICRHLEENGIDRFIFYGSDGHVLESAPVIPEARELRSRATGSQYFSLDEMPWVNDEVFVDCGVFVGETTIEFIECCMASGHTYRGVFGLEPDPINFPYAEEALRGLKNVRLIQAGAGDFNGTAKMTPNAASSCLSNDGTDEIDIVSLDTVLRDERVTFIKMDIEGSELSALRGASQIISAQRPKLAICVYHKYEDIWEIPEYIWSLNPEYKLFLRHYSDGPTETVLYAL